MTTILSKRKAGPWKRDVEKTKGTEIKAFYDRFQPSAGPGKNFSLKQSTSARAEVYCVRLNFNRF